MQPILILLGLFAVVLYWRDSLRCKELAILHGKRHCQRFNLQFLDETVAQYKIGFFRHRNGRVGLVRHYRFEFCTDGSKRYSGRLQLQGQRLESIELAPYIEDTIPASEQYTIESSRDGQNKSASNTGNPDERSE